MADDDESWRDIDPRPLFTAAMLRAGPRIKRIKLDPGIKDEPDIKAQDVKSERTPEPSSPPSSEASYPPSPDASCPPSPADSCSSPPPEASCPSPPEASRASSLEAAEVEHGEAEEEEEDDEEGEEEDEEEEGEEEDSCPCSPEPSCRSPSPKPTKVITEFTREAECYICEVPAVLRYVGDDNKINAGRPYLVYARGIYAENPLCECEGRVASRLEIICKKDKGKFGMGFWTCATGRCDYYSENPRGEPGVRFYGGFYPRLSDGNKRIHAD
ncbi:hypothetical protein KVR01_011868 [Diaporthe batatas]|uniref:uncharacterized protein n=1 Tax=Diaporthe batatas TaxID=748121 RepID=UPI001D045BB6|nr:uncharacterized protein KVR01_011868 [Diaporthe batatas]KAG8158107.1 hypothetical protein KVR01_011868 [Diaporthe batatas]